MLGGLVAGKEQFPLMLKRFGGEVIDVHAVSGRYDAVLIAEFPEKSAMLAYTLAATAQGQYAEALPVFEHDDLVRAEELMREAMNRFADDVAEQVDKTFPAEGAGRTEEKSS